ncbi:MAG: GNAT family N-acetyltransferase [Deltaproteobacteria bacterium]|nr:GNAT family N-acetyltransferase [Deltaproteobacteria bacterium]MBW2259223.1 GNAT family N-acetyltransferase [Deltaproteobacteria bacterium]
MKIRSARADDAAFLSWVILTAGRAHVKQGIWEVILGEPEDRCLAFLELLSVTETPHLFHHSCYFIAESGNQPVAGLGGYDPSILGYPALQRAFPDVFREMELHSPEALGSNRPPRILDCIPDEVEGAWIIDSVATLPEFRRQGIAGMLLRAILEKGLQQGFRRAQINLYIGNDAAQKAYEKHGFKVLDEKRDPYFEAEIGSPGMVRMVRDL